MLPGFYERHYARPQIGRAGRAVVAGETKLYDEASGQYHYIRRDRANQAREGVWASMIDGDALGPPDIPPSPPRGEAAAPVEMEPLPPDLVYDATAEERRQKMKARGLADLEAAPSKLPAGDGDALGSRARRVADVPAAAPSRVRLLDEPDAAAGDNDGASGRRAVPGVSQFAARGSLGVGSMMPDASAPSQRPPPRTQPAAHSSVAGALGGGEDLGYVDAPMAAHRGGRTDFVAIGNPRAEKFVLRSGGRRMQRGPREAHEGGSGESMASHLGTAPDETASYVPQRRPVPSEVAGGQGSADRVTFREGALVANLPPERFARRMYDHEGQTHEPSGHERRPRGRKHYSLEEQQGDPSVASPSRAVAEPAPFSAPAAYPPQASSALSPGAPAAPAASGAAAHFVSWYRSKYGEEPSAEMIERASRLSVAEPGPDPNPGPGGREQNAPPRSPIDTMSPRRRMPTEAAAPSALPAAVAPEPASSGGSAAHFVDWYTAKYGSAPPAHLVERAAVLDQQTDENRAPAVGEVEANAIPAQQSLPFMASSQFKGERPGYEFKGGDRGVGYYKISPEDADSKKRGPRAGEIGGGARSQNTGCSILGRVSTRVAAPPGGASSFSLGSD